MAFFIIDSMEQMRKIPLAFYLNNDVVEIAQNLLGKVLCTNINGQIVKAIITETEAYCGRNDKACHANNGKRTPRNEIMYAEGGKAYVYLCYGIHHLFNVVTNTEGLADAVLIRATEPVLGKDTMETRRNYPKQRYALTTGPGNMSKALGITTTLNGETLTGTVIWLEEWETLPTFTSNEIIASPRVGIDYAEEDAFLPWRFRIKDNRWTSKPK